MGQRFDVVVIGAGPGGYVCALRAAQLGFTVACIDRRPTPGGVCLNVGCIPSKALLHASHVYEQTKDLEALGIETGAVRLNLEAMMAFKTKGVTANTRGVEFLLRKNKIAYLSGAAWVLSPQAVEVRSAAMDTATVEVGHALVIASGSEPVPFPGVEFDEQQIVSSTGALEFSEVPQRLVVLGGGAIGLELGCVWQRLGAQVTVLELEERILPGMDGDLARGLMALLEEQGLGFRLGTRVASLEKMGKTVQVHVEGEAQELLEAEAVLVAIGRRACVEGLEALELALDERGRIVVDEGYGTNVAGVFAIGDAISGPMLAHKASEEGVALAEILAGQKTRVNYNAIPSVVYTHPEAASVGAVAVDEESRCVRFPFLANGRAKATGQSEGFVKIVAHKKTDRVLGVHILGAQAGEMIAEATLAMEFGASSEDIARTCHAHPTLSEAFKEAALACDDRALHM